MKLEFMSFFWSNTQNSQNGVKQQRSVPGLRCLPVLASMLILLFPAKSRGVEQTFTNPDSIQIQDNGAAPYPSTITVNGFSKAVERVSVTISNFSHSRPEDVDILLVSPGGRNVLLLSDAGATGSNEVAGVTNLTLVFDDFAPVQAPDISRLISGKYRPSDDGQADFFPPNAPPGSYGTELRPFRETNPNGVWQLYVVDDQGGATGSIGSWSLTIRGHSFVYAGNSITISNASPVGAPYPSTINVGNINGTITKVTVTLLEVDHSFPSDLDILLVGPSGQGVVLMSDAGGGVDASKVDLTFDDAAITIPPSNSALVSGRFRPGDYPDGDVFPAPAPAGEFGMELSVFNGKPANGAWQLFVVDDFPSMDGGRIAGGWRLAISTEPLEIVQQPITQIVFPGSNVAFYVSLAAVEPVTYLWRLNDMPILGATNRFLQVPQASLDNSGSYSVSIDNPFGTIHSEKALLWFDVPLNPSPDSFAQRRVLNGPSGFSFGTNFFKSKEAGEPRHAGKPGGASAWFSWTPVAGGIATFDTRGSTFDTLLGVYTGNNVSNLTLVARDEDSGGFFTSRASFNVAANQSYLIAVDGLTDEHGFFALGWQLEITSDLLAQHSRPTPGQTVPEGSNATMSVTATGSGLSHQWTLNGAPIRGATNTSLTVTDIHIEDVGTYQLETRTTTGRRTLSEPMVLEIGPITEIQSRAKKRDVQFIEAFYSVPASGGGAMAMFVTGSTNPYVSVSAGTSSGIQIINTFGGGSSTGTCAGIASPTRYMGVMPVDDGEFVVHTAGSTVRTALEVHRVIDDYGTTRCVDRSEGLPSYLRFSATRRARYILVAAADAPGVTGAVQLNWSFGVFLSIATTNVTNAVISWRAPRDTYRLQSAVALSSGVPGAWGDAAETVAFTVPNINAVTVSVRRATAPFPSARRFLRLLQVP